MSYIVYKEVAIARTDTAYKSGEHVKFSSTSCEEKINAEREVNLVGGFVGKISNNKKYNANKFVELPLANEVNPGEFIIYSD